MKAEHNLFLQKMTRINVTIDIFILKYTTHKGKKVYKLISNISILLDFPLTIYNYVYKYMLILEWSSRYDSHVIFSDQISITTSFSFIDLSNSYRQGEIEVSNKITKFRGYG